MAWITQVSPARTKNTTENAISERVAAPPIPSKFIHFTPRKGILNEWINTNY